MYWGDIKLGDTIDMKFTTRAFASGVPTTLAGSPSVAAYVDNNTTEITAGITLTVDFDSRTGLNNIRVVASNGNGFAAGTNISMVITAGTVGGTSVLGEEVASFSIENRAVNWAKVVSPTTAVDLSGTTIKTTQKVDIDTIKTQSVTCAGGVTVPAATLASTTNITAGTITTATNLTTNNDKTGYGLSSAAIQAIWDAATSALTTVGSIGKRLVDVFSGITSLANWLGALAGKQAADATAITEIKARGAGSGTYDETTDSQEAIRDRGDTAWITVTAASIRSAVGLASANLDTQLSGIQSDTDNLQTRIPAALSANGNMKSNILEISDDITAADLLEAFMDGALLVQVNGVASTTAIPIDGFTSVRNDQFKGRLITILNDSPRTYEQSDITAYTHATQTLTVTALTAAPADNVFILIH